MKTWVAMKSKDNSFGSWCVAPESFFEEWGFIPDTHIDPQCIPNSMRESERHVLVAEDGSDGRALLERAGFKVLDQPVWYFDREGYSR